MNKNKYVIIAALLIAFIMVIISLVVNGVRHRGTETEQPTTDVEVWSKEYYLQEQAKAKHEIEVLKVDYAWHEQEMIKDHEEADSWRLYLNEVNKEIYGTYWKPWAEKAMNKICELSPNSPMCNDREMLDDLMEVAEAKSVDYKLLLGIMYAESHIWANFKPYNCNITSNWAGLKARKYDDWQTSPRYTYQYEQFEQTDPNLYEKLNGCWLYYFENPHQFFESLANTISIGYKSCNEDVYCIMKSYVGHESWAWVRNVYLFKSL